MKYNSATQSWDASDSYLATAPNVTNNPSITGDVTGATHVVNTANTSPTVVSNYNTQSKVNDINNQYQSHASTQTPSFPTGTKQPVIVQGEDGSEIVAGYAANEQDHQRIINSYGGQTSFNTPFSAPQDAQLQPNGTYLYQGNYYTKDQLSSPESLAAISNTSIQQKKYDEALQSELSAINKRYDMYRQQQEQVTSSGAAGAQNTLLQSGAGGRGSVAQYAAATADARVQSIMADGQKALAELDSQRDQLLSAARVAYQDKNYQLLGNLNAQITKNRDQMISLAKEKNEAIAMEQKRLKQSQRDNLIAETYSAGTTEPAEILKTLNDNGGGFTLDEVTKGVDAIAKANGTNTAKMSQDVAEFYALKKEKGGLPVSVLGLSSTAEQIAAYLKMKSQAETKAKTSGTGSSSASVDIPEYDDPAYTVTVIRNSKGKKEMTGEQSKPITKALQAISQVDDLQKALIGQQTGPIWGTIRDKNPYDVKAQIIKGQLTALIPNLARGVYGEVGVLTDADIDNYSKTLGNLKSEKEVNDALIAITQKAAFNSIKTNLEAMAASNRDVSGFEPIYKNVQKNIEAKLPKVSPVGGSSAQDFINNPLPGTTGTVGQAYDPSIWSLFK